MHPKAKQSYDRRLARRLILNERFDVVLYTKLRSFARADTAELLDELIAIETGHLEFWEKFFDVRFSGLGLKRTIKLVLLLAVGRIFGEQGIHIILEAIEIHGIRPYLTLLDSYGNEPLGKALDTILRDELKHEEEIVSRTRVKKIHPQRIRDVFLGLNDGLVEMLGAVSGFFAAFQTMSAVIVAGLTVAVAGSISMAASAFAAASSLHEVETMTTKRKQFLGEPVEHDGVVDPLRSAAVVGVSYFFGALVPLLPVALGSSNLFGPLLATAAVTIVVSYLLAFLSGMNAERRVATNLIMIAVAVLLTYTIGSITRQLWGINI